MITTRRILVIVGAIATVSAITVAASADTADSTSPHDPVGLEQTFVADLNAERVAAGLAPLGVFDDLVEGARAHSKVMRDANHLHHNPNLAQVTDVWFGLGENVGVGWDQEALHDAFMASPPHRGNVLGEWNYVGVGVEVDGQVIWVTVVFMVSKEGWEARQPWATETVADEVEAPVTTQDEPASSVPPAPTSPGQSETTVGLVDPTTGMWHLRHRSGAMTSFYYGDPGDYPMMGDWDCDGVDTPGLYRQSDGYVYLRNSNTAGIGDVRFYFGNPGDVPLAGDFDGDGCDSVSIYRPHQGRVYVINRLGAGDAGLGAADFEYAFGDSGLAALAADFDGDGVDEVAVYDRSSGRAAIRLSHGAASDVVNLIVGNPGDVPLAGDWDDGGLAVLATYRPATATMEFADPAHRSGATAAPTGAGAQWFPVAGRYGLDG